MVEEYPLLELIESPEDLRNLPRHRLRQVAAEVRNCLLHTVASAGGHLGAGLGVVELTIALHYVYQTPEDRLIWDVGHQAYPHKILTGRRRALSTIRKSDGLAPFPKRGESRYDAFGVGHSSTSISAALGMAIAARRFNRKRKVVAVIGDGALTAGLAFEALDHAGDIGADVLVVVNDNEMSISPNVGAISTHLARLLSGRTYAGLRETGKRALGAVPPVQALARRAEEHLMGIAAPSTLFGDLGFRYYGPVDGHDLDSLIPILRNLRGQTGPRVLHVITRKGKGYSPAESDPVTYHGVSPFDPSRGIIKGAPGAPTYTQVFSDWICDMAAVDRRLVGITPAMREGSGLTRFSERFPDRYFDVGIAEQHAVTLAAGMACDGLKPVVAIYSTFLQRGYDQLIHDVAIQNLPVVFAIDRAGLVGPDGPTHAGAFDLSYLRCVPNLVVMVPGDTAECRRMLSTAFRLGRPVAVRYPKGAVGENVPSTDLDTLPIGVAQERRQGSRVALLAFGAPLEAAERVAERLDATVVNMRFVKPLDERCVLELADEHELLVTLEDNVIVGGAGTAVLECLAAHGRSARVLTLGLPDWFVEHGTRDSLLAACDLDEEGIFARVERALQNDGGDTATVRGGSRQRSR